MNFATADAVRMIDHLLYYLPTTLPERPLYSRKRPFGYYRCEGPLATQAVIAVLLE